MVKVCEVRDDNGGTLQVVWGYGDDIHSTWLNKILFPDRDALEAFLLGQHQERFYTDHGRVFDRTLGCDEYDFIAAFYVGGEKGSGGDDYSDAEAAERYAAWLNRPVDL